MSLGTKRIIFWIFWLLIVLSGPITVIRNSDLRNTFANTVVLTNFFQRMTGLLAFSLLFIQIILGSWMGRWLQIIGAKAYKIHITQGLVIYLLMLIHPLFENAIVYLVSKNIIDALYVFIPSLGTERAILLVFGRTAFLLATIAVIASYFRTKPFFRRNWQAFHILNYLVFILIFIHMRLGTDIVSPPFVWVSWIALIGVLFSLVHRFLYPLLPKSIFQRGTDIKEQKA